MKNMNQRAIALQFLIFVMQWGLMIIGFGILALIIAPLRLPTDPSLGRYFDAGLKALIALVLSVSWLFIWDRQVRNYFYRKGETTAEAN
jgi:4-amino-4-deoxy-L-arabinose transferase-like glycosyltransferase